MSQQNIAETDIAIIGMSGRFPQSRDLDEWWRNLYAGKELITFFTDEELKAQGVDAASLGDPLYVKAAAVLDDPSLFDADYFGFNPREAEVTDPQHRVFLECAHEALENAGYLSDSYDGRIGVYAGQSMNTYLLANLAHNPEAVESVGGYQVMIGNDKDFLCTLVSYKLNLKGPSLTVQTACSTSLVAVHLACQSLLNGECDVALAGGVSIKVPHKTGYRFREGGIMSPDGHCRAFDDRSRGTVDGNGAGIVVLKRLSEAMRDGDTVRAVIKGSAINNDGLNKIGYTAPSEDGQAEAIAEAMAVARVSPETIGYVEAHGTGTPLGDPIEIAALTRAYRMGTSQKQFCAIGSVKTNMGHLDAAAGVAGLMKTVLALENKALPPSLHFEKPNSKIDFANSPFMVNQVLRQWERNGAPRRAGISSFGIGGTNAHAVLEEAPQSASSDESKPWQLLTLSTKAPGSLDAATNNLLGFLKSKPQVNLADLAYTLQTGRKAHSHRRAVVCRDVDDAVAALENMAADRVVTSLREPTARQVVFMFPGQGTQYPNMGGELYRSEAVFRHEVDRCCEILISHLGFDLRQAIFTKPGDDDGPYAARLRQTAVTQPALFVIEYALAMQWMEWGIRPHAMIGHSIGEYVAACLAGVFSLKDTLSLVAERGRLIQSLDAGAMLAIPLPEKQVRLLLDDRLSLAAVNGRSLCVVSGTEEVIAELGKSVEGKRLHTSHAFHSAMMDPILAAFSETVSKVHRTPPSIPFISNVTGTWITISQALDPGYWAKHLREAVRFDDGIAELLKEPDRVLLEVGPGRALSALAKPRLNKEFGHQAAASLPAAKEDQGDRQTMLTAIGKLWAAGIGPDWSSLFAGQRRRRIPAPTYPFDRRRYWVEPVAHTALTARGQMVIEKKADVADWFYVPGWKRSVPFAAAAKGERIQSPWLVFVDDTGFGASVVSKLRERGEEVIEVVPGQQFTASGKSSFTVDPAQPHDYIRLIRQLVLEGNIAQRVIHLWGVTREDRANERVTFTDGSQYRGIYSLLFLAQGLNQLAKESVQLAVVSTGIQEIDGREMVQPEKATMLAPCIVIPQEHPNLACRSIDIRLGDTTPDELIAELDARQYDMFTGVRNGHRWTQTFEPARIESKTATPARLRERGVYLITGGLGNIGLAIAEHLAKTIEAKLALVGRSPFPTKNEWKDWLSRHDESDPTCRILRRLTAIEEQGGEVLVLQADVAESMQMREAFEAAERQFGPINGIIHGAGTLAARGFGELAVANEGQCELHFGPKARGLLVLDELLRNREFDFCLMLSSISSVLGGLGYMAYAAANLFMDAFARQKRLAGDTRWIAVNWDAWRFGAEPGPAKTGLAALSMNEEEGIAVCDQILSVGPLSQIVVSTGDLNARVSQWVKREDRQKVTKGHLDLHPRPGLSNTHVAPRHEVDRVIAGIWETLLGVERIGINDNFFELGGHSLLVPQVVSRLRDTFRIEVPLRRLFESPTFAELSDCVIANDATPGRAQKIAKALIVVQGMSAQEVSKALEQKNAAVRAQQPAVGD